MKTELDKLKMQRGEFEALGDTLLIADLLEDALIDCQYHGSYMRDYFQHLDRLRYYARERQQLLIKESSSIILKHYGL